MAHLCPINCVRINGKEVLTVEADLHFEIEDQPLVRLTIRAKSVTISPEGVMDIYTKD